MIIYPANVHAFLEEFHTRQTEMVVAILLLTERRQDELELRDMIDRMPELNEALGPHVGLYLFAPGAGQPIATYGDYGRTGILAGERLDQDPDGGQDNRRFFANLDMKTVPAHDHEAVRNAVARSSVAASRDFARALGVPEEDLPVACAVIRGEDGVVTAPLRTNRVVKTVALAARYLVDNLNPVRRQIVLKRLGGAGVRDVIAEMEMALTKVDKRQDRIVRHLEALERKYSIVLRPQVLARLRLGGLTRDGFGDIVAGLPGDIGGHLIRDSRADGICNLLDELAGVNAEVADLVTAQGWDAFAADVALIEDNAGAIRAAVERAFIDSGVSVRPYPAALAKNSGVFLGIALRAIGLVRRMHGAP